MKTTNQFRRVCGLVVAAAALAWQASPCLAVGFHGGGGGRGGGGMAGGRGAGGFGGGGGPSLGGFGGGMRGPSLGGLSMPGGLGGGGFAGGIGGAGLGGGGIGAGGYGSMGLGNFPRVAPGGGAGLGGEGLGGIGAGGLDHGGLPGFPSLAGGGGFQRAGGGSPAAQLGNFLGLPGGGPVAGGAGAPVRPAWLDQGGGAAAGAISRPPATGGGAAPWAAGYAGNRPSWLNPASGAAAGVAAGSQIGNRIANSVQLPGDRAGQAQNWLETHPERAQQWQGRGDQIRQQWDSTNHPLANDAAKIPGSDWWSKYHPNLAPWYYHHDWHNHGWAYWWGAPAWGSFATWFPTWGWAAPVYYDYGDGGNVVYQDQKVYVNGQDVGSAADYAASAANLATVDPQAAESNPTDNDWMALGTFAVETSPSDSSTTRVLQLAVDRQGIVSGTMHNSSTNQSYVVQGRVDKQTQRVAFTIGDKSDVVMETGIYNLTQQQTPVLVHFGPNKTENYLLVRLDPPGGAAAGGENGDAAGASEPNPFSP